MSLYLYDQHASSVTLIVDGRREYLPEQICCTQVIVIHDPSIALPNAFPQLAQRCPDAVQIVPSTANWADLLSHVHTDSIGYIPCGAALNTPIPDLPANSLAPWVPTVTLPELTARELSLEAIAWIASTTLALASLPQLGKPENWTILAVARALETSRIPFRWQAARASQACLTPTDSELRRSPRSLTVNSTVLAVIPHYGCEAWLHRCINSLLAQTRSPDGIVVIDDGSENPPVDLVKEFPGVTLLRSSLNVGPYRLIQQIIEQTHYEAYLFQDADDWSSCDRLEKLLQAAIVFDAELVGTQEFRVYEEQSRLVPVCYPLDVNCALQDKPGHPLLHPTSLVTRDLVMRLGGFATGLRFGGDTEFLLRAALIARVVNLPEYCYYRRKRAGSLTTAPATGLESPARTDLTSKLKNRALANSAAKKAGHPIDLHPLCTAKPIELLHLVGPHLRWAE